MSKRKLAIFFLIAAAVFAASQGEHVRHAEASVEPAPTTQPTPWALQR
jgi:hypothetical protein